jgi:hypothetical protein
MSSQNMSCIGVLTIIASLSLSPPTARAADGYAVFHGRQVWPTSDSTTADTNFSVPVYRDWPDHSYRVIGTIQCSQNPSQFLDDATVAATLAKTRNADAIIVPVVNPLEPRVATKPDSTASPASHAPVTILVIQWKTPAEMDADRRVAAKFWSDFQTRHSGFAGGEEFKKISLEYAAFRGMDLNSKKDCETFEKDLNEVLNAPPDAASTKWLFHGTFHADGVAASVDQTICGLAVLSRTGDGLAIVSKSDGAGFNFTGVDQEHRISGPIDFSVGPAACQAKAQGAMLPRRISLDSRGQDERGTMRSSLTFVR